MCMCVCVCLDKGECLFCICAEVLKEDYLCFGSSNMCLCLLVLTVEPHFDVVLTKLA